MAKEDLKKVFCDTLIEMASADDRICLVNSDSRKYTATQDFDKAFPERSFDVGIAEANMVGVAAGLAVSGKKPFTQSFGPFMSRRVVDQVTISLAYSKLNAVLVGVSPGIQAEVNGGTHQGYEDIGVFRPVANMTIVEPFDGVQLRQMLPELIKLEGPVYLRYDRAGIEPYYGVDYKFVLGKADTLREGKDVTIISSGVMLTQCLEAAEVLANQGVQARVINMHTIKPIDADTVVRAAKETGAIITVENHSVIGGLGSAVAEVLAEQCPCKMHRLGIQDRFGEVGDRAYLRKCMGIDTTDIVHAALNIKK